MAIIFDVMIGLGAFLAAAYCMLLSRRLRSLTRLDGDVGKAIAVLSQQVDALAGALKAAELSNTRAGKSLSDQIAHAEATARQLELLLAAHRPPEGRKAPQPAARHTAGVEVPASTEDGDSFAPIGRTAPPSRPELRRRVTRQREPLGEAR
ncbi:MAG: hypothetical protein ACXIUW_12985 [Roseinatronobacter sp.]